MNLIMIPEMKSICLMRAIHFDNVTIFLANSQRLAVLKEKETP